MNLKGFKQQNPAYADVPDQQLADALYRKHYAQTGMTRAEFYAKAQVEIADPEQAPKEGSDFLSVAQQVPGGIWRGLGQAKDALAYAPLRIADMPHNMVAAPVNAVLEAAGIDREIPMRDSVADYHEMMRPISQSKPGQVVNRALNSIGDRLGYAPEPQDAAERVAAKTGEYIGAALPFIAAPQAMATRAPATYATTPANAPTAMGQVGQNMLKGTMNAPVRTAAVDAGLAATSGVGGGIGQEYGGDRGEMIGAMTAPMGLSAATFFSPTFMAGRLARTIAPTVSDKAATSRAREMVGQTLGDELPRYQQEVARSQQVEQAVNEAARSAGSPDRMNLSLAERTGSPALVAAQRDLDERVSGPVLEAARKRRDAQDRAIDTFAEVNAPVSRYSAETLARLARSRSDALSVKLREKQTEAQIEREILAGRVPTTDLFEQGTNIRGALGDRRKAVRAAFDQRARDEGLNSADLTLDFSAFQQRVRDAYAAKNFDNPQYRPKVLDDIVGYKAEGSPAKQQPVTFLDVKNLRERIVDDLLVSQRSSNPTEKMREASLSRLLKDFDGFIGNAELKNADPKLAEAWKNYRRDYRELYINTFRQPDIRGYAQRDTEGFQKMANEAVAADLVKPGNIRAVRAYKTALEAMEPMTPEYLRGIEAVEAAALDNLSRYAVRDGVIDPARLTAWQREHRDLLNELPFLQGTVADVAETNTRLLARQQTLANRARIVERGALEKKLAQVETGTTTPDALIETAIKNPTMAQRLRSRLRDDPAALNGLRAEAWGRIPLDNPADTRAYLDQHAKSLSVIFSPEHLRNVRFIADAREMADRLPMPGGAAPEQVPFRKFEEAANMSIPSIGAALRTVQTGRTTLAFEVPRIGINFLRGRSKKQMDEIWQKALFDAEVARDLAETIRKPDPLTLRKLASRTFRFGVGIDPDRPNAWVAGPLVGQPTEERERRPMVPYR